jgi:hypothetical protein
LRTHKKTANLTPTAYDDNNKVVMPLDQPEQPPEAKSSAQQTYVFGIYKGGILSPFKNQHCSKIHNHLAHPPFFAVIPKEQEDCLMGQTRIIIDSYFHRFYLKSPPLGIS